MKNSFTGREPACSNGEGYLGRVGYNTGRVAWRDLPEAVKAEVLDAMRADWRRHSVQVMQAWADRDHYEREYLAVQYHGDPANPWALEQFGAHVDAN